MRGSIRSLIGFLIVFGVVGGLDTNSIEIWMAIPVAGIGLLFMAWGVSALKQKYN